MHAASLLQTVPANVVEPSPPRDGRSIPLETERLPSGRLVLCPAPFVPAVGALSPFVGRGRERTIVGAAWLGCGGLPPLAPLLTGEPGVGKNRIVYELAAALGRPLYIVQGHEDLTAEDLACSVRFADVGTGAMEYVLSPLAAALLRGGICFLDEVGKMRARALAPLVSVLDERRYIDSSLLGERIHAHPAFRFAAATNTGEERSLPDFIRSRLRPVVEVAAPDVKDIDGILQGCLVGFGNVEVWLNGFWEPWLKAGRHPSPREALQHIAMATRLAAQEAQCGHAPAEGGPARLGEAFEILFGGKSA